MAHEPRASGVAYRCADITNRLFAAADLLLIAIQSPQGFDSVIALYGGSLRIGRCPPPGVYTADEIVDAMSLLIRLGLVPAEMARPSICRRDDGGGGARADGRLRSRSGRCAG